MNLLIDWGNTNLKFILIDELSIEAIELAEFKKCSEVNQLLLQLPDILNSVLICSVRSDRENSLLKNLLAKIIINEHIYFAKTALAACGVQCAYQEPQYLGVDRWLAILAAARHNETVVVIDAGSAITIDVVDNKVHLGGQIAPGKPLMQRSLKLTGQVRPKPVDQEDNSLFGRSTAACVNKGIETAVSGYLNFAIDSIDKELRVTRWIVAGGDHQLVGNLLSKREQNFEVHYKLVFQGLLKLFLESSKGYQTS
ncbi:MAG: type III pantothenate kinase [Kangiellaceae bacterium]|nr:type III pantothenate kinase [Kangiellaceae bacterium]MCW9000654.1 type III pantothenate kinase [Kangiellaceae bacterium]